MNINLENAEKKTLLHVAKTKFQKNTEWTIFRLITIPMYVPDKPNTKEINGNPASFKSRTKIKNNFENTSFKNRFLDKLPLCTI